MSERYLSNGRVGEASSKCGYTGFRGAEAVNAIDGCRCLISIRQRKHPFQWQPQLMVVVCKLVLSLLRGLMDGEVEKLPPYVYWALSHPIAL